MTQNYLILIFFIEVAIFYLILYSLIRANKWVNAKIELFDEYANTLPENMANFRSKLADFNKRIFTPPKEEPLSGEEISELIIGIIGDILKSRVSILPFAKKSLILSIILKIWKYRNRIKATVLGSR